MTKQTCMENRGDSRFNLKDVLNPSNQMVSMSSKTQLRSGIKEERRYGLE